MSRVAQVRDALWVEPTKERAMLERIHVLIGCVCLASFSVSCGSQPLDEPEERAGALRAAIAFGPSTHDVTAVRFDLVAVDEACDAPTLATLTVPLEGELAPASVSGGEAASHHFASGLFTVAPGDYRACATPLRSDSSASEACAQASDLTTVSAELTTQLSLVSQCQGASAGGLDVAVSLNDPPQITAVAVTPSAFITVCESASIAVTAEDPNGDALSFDWSVVSGSVGGRLRASQGNATFSGEPGDYVLRVTAADAHAADASFLVSVHVTDATCSVPPEVQSIITSQCAPCHTTGASGGLKLDPAEVTYTSLVNRSVGAAACASQVRVVPGDASHSYLIAKLRNTPGICGLAMPRNRPPLPEEQLQTIEAWINALPH
jgi:PKD domain